MRSMWGWGYLDHWRLGLHHLDRTWVYFLLRPSPSSKVGLSPQEAKLRLSWKEFREPLFEEGEKMKYIPDSLLDTNSCTAQQAAGEIRLSE